MKAIKIVLTKVRCLEETDEVGSDEPYVIVTAVSPAAAPVPNVESILYGGWASVDTGDLLQTMPVPPGAGPALLDSILLPWRRPCWGLDGKAAVIANPDDVIFVVSVMENDDGDPKVARGLVKASAVSSLAASKAMDRPTRVGKLINDINSALKMPTGAPNFDDLVGTKELRLKASDLQKANAGLHAINLLFTGDGGQYRLRFELSQG